MTLRIVDGDATSGRLEIWRRGHWGTFCTRYFDDSAATLACRTLGLGYIGVKTSAPQAPRPSTLIDIITCPSDAASFWDCGMQPFPWYHVCDSGSDVGVACYQGTNGRRGWCLNHRWMGVSYRIGLTAAVLAWRKSSCFGSPGGSCCAHTTDCLLHYLPAA